jgi:copper resistance protein C
MNVSASPPCRLVVALLLTLQLTSAVAHTTLEASSPKNGAELTESPQVIELNFREAASLTAVMVRPEGKAERKLDFFPKGAAKSFKLTNPLLEPGRNTVHWKALSTDGHVISGTLTFVVKPTSTTSP